MMRKKGNHSAKVIFLGNSGVGKTHLIYSLSGFNDFDRLSTTVGVDVRKLIVNFESDSIQLRFWDTAGQQKFRTITSSYFNYVDAIIYVYSLTNRQSFTEIKKWFQESFQKCNNCVKVLVGNKVDLQDKRVIYQQQGIKLTKELQQKYKTLIYFKEVSALNKRNVEDVLKYLSQQVFNKKVQQNPMGRRKILLSESSDQLKQKRKCC